MAAADSPANRNESGTTKVAEREKVTTEFPWQLTCLCGEVLSGQRQKKVQIVRCAHCDRRQFVLPISPYKTAPKAKKKQRRGKKKLPRIPLQPYWQYSVGLGARMGKGLRQATVGGIQISRRKLWEAVMAIKAWLSPLRLAVLAISLVLVLAGLLGWRQHRHQLALQTLRTVSQQAEQALSKQDWPTATAAYAQAAEAVRILGRDDAFAQEILQKNRELQAADRLCNLPLSEVLQEAAGKGKVVGHWAYLYETAVQNHWIVMECWLQPDPQHQEAWLSLAQALPLEGEYLNIRWPRQLVSTAEAKASEPVHLLCAGQIQSLEKSPENSASWLITIRPETAFLWAYPETCAAVGFDLQAPWQPEKHSLSAVLKQQQARVINGEKP